MSFEIKKRGNKTEEAMYRTLYIKCVLAERVDKLAVKLNRSFNSVVIEMIESCMEDIEREEKSLV